MREAVGEPSAGTAAVHWCMRIRYRFLVVIFMVYCSVLVLEKWVKTEGSGGPRGAVARARRGSEDGVRRHRDRGVVLQTARWGQVAGC